MKSWASFLCTICLAEWQNMLPHFYRVFWIPGPIQNKKFIYCEHCLTERAYCLTIAKKYFEDGVWV